MLTRTNAALAPEREAIVTRTIGCAIRVHQALGPGFHEAIYQDAMGVELEWEGLPFQKEFQVAMFYRGRPLRTQRLDLVVDGLVVVELKAVESGTSPPDTTAVLHESSEAARWPVNELPRRVLEIAVEALCLVRNEYLRVLRG